MEEVADTLFELGLTKTQATVLIALQNFISAPVREIAKAVDLHRQEVYRVLEELQDVGLVEKRISYPPEYCASSLDQSIKILFERKKNWFIKIELKANKLASEASKAYKLKKETPGEKYYFTFITGYERFRKAAVSWQENVETVDVATSLDSIEKVNLMPIDFKYKKGTRIRIVTCVSPIPEEKIPLSHMDFKDVKREVRFTPNYIPADFAVYGGKIANFSMFQKSNGHKHVRNEIATLASNHPAFVNMIQLYFNVLWENAKQYGK